jgi:hypothetical protein
MSRPYAKVKDKIKIEFNPLTGQFDLVSEFNANRIVTHSLSPFANPIQNFDPVVGVYYDAGDQIVTDSNGNVVVI